LENNAQNRQHYTKSGIKAPDSVSSTVVKNIQHFEKYPLLMI
jgi:hypothetical protein